MEVLGGEKGYRWGTGEQEPPMPVKGDPIPLMTMSKPNEVVAYACAKCMTVVAGVGKGAGLFSDEQAKEIAAKHCGPWTCEDCGAEHNRSYQPTCDKCYAARNVKRRQEQEAALLEKAVKVYQWDGPVFWDDGPGNGFFRSVEDVIDAAMCDNVRPPDHVWTCNTINPHVDPGDIIDQALEDLHEDAYVNDELELRKFIEAWNEKQDSETWEPNYKVAVLIEYPCDVGEE